MQKVSGLLLIVVFGWWNAVPSAAQMFSQGDRGSQSLRAFAAGYQWIDFAYNGSSEPTESFDYRAPAYALYFTQPNMSVSIAYGHQNAQTADHLRDLRLIDAALFLGGGLPLVRSRLLQLELPFLLHSGYRSVDDQEGQAPSIEAFNLTTLGLGTGLGVRSNLGRGIHVEGQATPIGGLALRTLEGTAGRTWLVRGSARLHFARLIRRYGLSIGYSYRYQRWNIEASDLFPQLSADLFDYKNQQHVLHVGVNW